MFHYNTARTTYLIVILVKVQRWFCIVIKPIINPSKQAVKFLLGYSAIIFGGGWHSGNNIRMTNKNYNACYKTKPEERDQEWF